MVAIGTLLHQMAENSGAVEGVADALMPIFVVASGFSYGLGINPVPFTLLGEVLPQSIKMVACCIILCFR